jgi:hypothetical protein
VIALSTLLPSKIFGGLAINLNHSEYSQEIADPLMRLMEGVKMQ